MSDYSPAERDQIMDDFLDSARPLRARVERLEQTIHNRAAGNTFAKAADFTAAGEATLAKAVNAFSDPSALLAYADRHIDDVTTIGVVSGHLAAGDMMRAKQTVLEYAERAAVVAKADDVSTALGQVTGGLEGDFASCDSKAAVSEITARFSAMERTIAALETRLAQLERRPQAAAPVVPEQTVAKAAGAPRRPKTPEETAESLLAQIDAYIDSPSVVGQLSSMVAAGKFADVRRIIAGAKQAHDTQRLIAERKGFNQN